MALGESDDVLKMLRGLKSDEAEEVAAEEAREEARRASFMSEVVRRNPSIEYE